MKLTISARKIELTDGIKTHIEQKYEKLDRYFQDDATVNATVSVEKDRQKIETVIHFHNSIIRVENTNSDLYIAIDKSVDDIERKLRKHKTKLHNRLRSGYSEALPAMDESDIEPEENAFNIVKVKRFDVKPMSAEEAVLQMNLLNHQFYVFKDLKDTTNVVYRRKDGNYALIEVLKQKY